MNHAILLPGLAMAALTFVVWWAMYFQRIGQMKRERIHPQAVATSIQAAARLTESNRADNFRNLFELPVLFYFALTVAHLSGQVNAATLALAWLFVALRVVHSAIHCTYNKVMHRFYAYLAGGLALWALWGVLGYGLLRG
ncbi:MAPEG family protein [Vulcaniibacterium thermophilum]|uniref:Membrane protein n=1 Tax=Vulcaniibacterium thermophilum TaxID=1169913 RepID=A0A919DD59_9GAMM|nr:MAPEG family protein [Vulcaniibacterium thermophilum]GHE37975.1 membrane protein [Vulcaniibacterium thermophilum]